MNKDDILWREGVCAKAKGKCEICYKEGCDPHHVIKRRFKKVKHLIINGVWLCRKCHSWAEQNPKKFLEWFFRKYGENLYYELKRLANKV